MSPPFSDRPLLLSEEEAAALQAWVDAAKRQLALSDWEITVSRHEAQPGAIASSFVRHQADISTIAVSAEWRDWSLEELRQNLTHELLHPHFERVTAMADKLVENELGTRTEAVIRAAVGEVEEQSIDRLATAIAHFLPLPAIPPAPTGEGGS